MTTGLIDLHIHTTASDGTMTPARMVFHAAGSGLKAVAITDHDTVDGVSEAIAAGKEAGIEVVPGVEIGVDYPGEMHILGYYIDHKNSGLARGLSCLCRYREERNPMMIEKLRELGFDITLEEVAGIAGGNVIGRPHFAALLTRKGYTADNREAFDRYLGAGKPAYVKKDRLSPQDGIKMIIEAGGIPVLAHPRYLRIREDHSLKELIHELRGFGLKGIEVFYPEHTPEETERFYQLASATGLLVTGGTDFHGTNKPGLKIGTGPGDLRVRYSLLEKLKKNIPNPSKNNGSLRIY